MLEPDQFDSLPDFAIRLGEAMRAAGLNAETLAVKVDALGVRCNRQHVNRLREGTSSNPSARLVHAITVACAVSLDYFFVREISPDMRRELFTRQQKRSAASSAAAQQR